MDTQYHSTTFLPMTSAAQQHQQQQQHPHHHLHHHHQQPQQPQQHHYNQPYSTMPGQQQQPSVSSAENSTLPPLQPPTAGYSHLPSIYTSQQHAASPHTTHPPSSNASSAQNAHAFSHMPNPATSASMPPPSSYGPIPSGYATSQSAGHPSSGNSNMPSNRLPDLRPAPQNSFNAGFPNFGGPNPMAQGQYMPGQEQEPPTHVVGSQGRRGILPSAPGRAAPPTGVAATSKSMIPAKDADGKFPCPHCNKTYLHAKHLKRHLLRHTGDRPYMCHLCKDTFSRSDILKRHFQKCSVRRGNPTGANHLAHQRRNTNPSNRLSLGNEPIGLAGLANAAGGAPAYTNGDGVNPSSSSPTVNGDQSSYASSVASISNRSSRANSLIQPGILHPDSRHVMNGLGIPNLASAAANGEHAPSSSAAYGSGMPAYTMRPHSSSTPVPPTYSAYGSAMPNGLYSASKAEDHHGNYTAHGGSVHNNWGNMFNSNGHDGFMGQPQQDHPHMPVKTEHGVDGQHYNPTDGQNESFLNGLYAHSSAYADDAATRIQ